MMDSIRKTGRIVGALFLTVMVTFYAGHELVGSVLNAPDYLAQVYPNRSRVITGVFLELIEVVAVVGITVIMAAILTKHHKRMALGYVVFRTLECVMLIVAMLSPLLLITLSQEYVQAGAPESSYFRTVGAMLTAARDQWSTLVLAIFYDAGALIFYYYMYKSKLMPRVIPVLGFFAVAFSLIDGVVLAISGHSAGTISGLPVSGLPMGLLEIVLALWLIVKGFNSSALVSGPVHTGTDGSN